MLLAITRGECALDLVLLATQRTPDHEADVTCLGLSPATQLTCNLEPSISLSTTRTTNLYCSPYKITEMIKRDNLYQ